MLTRFTPAQFGRMSPVGRPESTTSWLMATTIRTPTPTVSLLATGSGSTV